VSNAIFTPIYAACLQLLKGCGTIKEKEDRMMELKGSKTEMNLRAAFAGESQARNMYTYFASKAKKEGFEQIAELFLLAADNEKEHAKLWFKHFHGDNGTLDNLLEAAAGEHHEWIGMYKEFAATAKKEGFADIVAQFELVAAVEKEHEAMYRKLAQNVKDGKVFAADADTVWKCRNCGLHAPGKDAPEQCLACKHPQAYFEVFKPNY